MIATDKPFIRCERGLPDRPITRDEALALIRAANPDAPGFWLVDRLHGVCGGNSFELSGGVWLEAAT